MKYTMYKSLKNTISGIGIDVKKHELIEVANGNCISDVAASLRQAVIDDLSETEEHRKYNVHATAPLHNENTGTTAERSRYNYYIIGTVSAPFVEEYTDFYYPIIAEEN